ncbi:MAG: DUF2208 family protein [Thermoproteales archaeon]|nr:DUF2208 family protein [Thermoproteales archaeon]
MNRYIMYVVGIIATVIFAWLSSFRPDLLSLMFIGYIVIVFGATFLITGKSAARIVKDLEYIEKGQKLFTARKESVNKIKIMDPRLNEDLKTQGIIMILYFIPTIIIFALVFIPGFRDQFLSSVSSLILPYVGEKQTSLFFAYLTFYGMFYVISIGFNLFSRLFYRGKGVIMIPSEYVVTDRGIIVDKKTPLKFPLKGNIHLNESRKFVEIIVDSPQPGMQKVRYRFYTQQVKKLYEILRGQLERA